VLYIATLTEANPKSTDVPSRISRERCASRQLFDYLVMQMRELQIASRIPMNALLG
jgi:hypothetical protein